MWLRPVWSTLGDSFHKICLQKSESWQHHDDRFHGLCGQIPWSTMDVSHSGQLEFGHSALYVHQVNVISLGHSHLAWFNNTHIRSRAASCSCCFRLYGRFLTVRPGSCFRWLHLQSRGELSGVCIVVGSQRVAYWKKRPSFCSILFHAEPAEVFVESWFAAVEVERWW